MSDSRILTKPGDLSNGFHLAECVVNVTGWLPPDLELWPQETLDELFIAAETLAQRTGKKYVLYHAEYGYEPGDAVHYIRAICIAPIQPGDKPISGDN